MDILDDGSLKIQYNRNRYYDSYTGRWTTHDPLGITPNQWEANRLAPPNQYNYGLNLYEYVSSNPVDRLDASGSTSVESILATIRGIRECAPDYIAAGRHVPGVIRAAARAGNPRCLPGSLTVLTVSGAGNPYAHCVWSCEVAKENGAEVADECNRRKEDLDTAVADLADAIRGDSCWNLLPQFAKKHLAAWACSANQGSDISDNATGIGCGTDECVKAGDKTCGDCCGENGVPAGTPEGDERRPYGSRCKPRYLTEMGEKAIAEGWGPGK